MRAAVIGTGLIAHNHAQALRQQGHELFWVVSRRLISAKQFAGQYGCEHYSDALTEEVLENVDVVHICTPPGDHFAYAKALQPWSWLRESIRAVVSLMTSSRMRFQSMQE